MAFELKNIVPWGRNLNEYKAMFNLSENDINKRIVSFGDGPASFNAEMTRKNKDVISVDPVYQFSEHELRSRIDDTKEIIISQIKNNQNNFVWDKFGSIHDLVNIRLVAMNLFLSDFEAGKNQRRYINHGMPAKTGFADLYFDLGLSSHFLLLYSQLGLAFHIASIEEMLRVSKEIRIFPILNLDGQKSELLDDLIRYFESGYIVRIEEVDYEFQKNGNQMLTIKHSN
jgi:hypothetical protein